MSQEPTWSLLDLNINPAHVNRQVQMATSLKCPRKKKGKVLLGLRSPSFDLPLRLDVHISKMAATLSFRWLEILENEFDKAFVDLDLLLGEVDPDQCEITFEGRQKMTALSAAFAQLCHKAQTIFQSNAKLEVRKVKPCTLHKPRTLSASSSKLVRAQGPRVVPWKIT